MKRIRIIRKSVKRVVRTLPAETADGRIVARRVVVTKTSSSRRTTLRP